MSQPVSVSYPPVPGPHDRVRFEQMQTRQRRAVLWYGALGIVAVIAAGVPVSLVVTPLIFLIAFVVVRIAGLFLAIPPALPALAAAIDAAARPALKAAIALQWPSIDLRVALLLFAPGAAAMVGLWTVVRRLVTRVGAGGALLGIGIRQRASPDFEQHQLENTVGEMAIAAGTRPPAMRLLDVEPANAAAVGTGPDDATLVVTRGLLDRLDRDETQAVVAHLVASIGNGDLAASTLLLSVQQTLGLLIVALSAPFGRRSRRLIGMLLRRDVSRDTETISELLAGAPLETDDDASREMTALVRGSPLRIASRVLLFPLPFVAIAARMAAAFVLGGIFGPIFAAMWRRRRLVADAMAVQLTRNPDALARALAALTSGEHHIEGALGAAHLFVVWQPDQSGRYLSRVFGGLGTLSPSIPRRRDALRRMGAGSVTFSRRTWGWRDLLREPTRTILLVLPPLLVIGGYAAALMVWVVIAYTFVLVGLLVLAINGALDLAARIIARIG